MTKRFNIALVAVALLLVLVAIMPVSAYTLRTSINQGATIFIGEEGLNLTPAQLSQAAGTDANTISWWASAADLTGSSATKSISLVGRNTSFTVSPSDFVGYTGNWYFVYGANGSAVTPAAFTVTDPTLDLKVWDFGLNKDVSGMSIPQGQVLGFRIDTNMYNALGDKRWSVDSAGNVHQFINKSDGYIDIKVKDENGATLKELLNASTNDGGEFNSLLQLNVSTQPWTWGNAQLEGYPVTQVGTGSNVRMQYNWTTDALDTNGQYAYPVGTYTISAESLLNNMKDNHKNAGADYTGKTVSQSVTLTLVSDTVKITANKDSVVRSKSFSVTVTGKPKADYYLWVKGTSSMTGGYDSQPPLLREGQTGVFMDPYTAGNPVTTAGYVGSYNYENSGTKLLWNDVCSGDTTHNDIMKNGTLVYANITLSDSGTRTVEFLTTNWTKAQKYTIRAERLEG